MTLYTEEGETRNSVPVFLWGALLKTFQIHIYWQTEEPVSTLAPQTLHLYILLLYQIMKLN